MKKPFLLGAVAAAILAVTPSIAGTTAMGCASCAYTSWSTTDLDEEGSPFWDSPSGDGSQMNVGNFLTGTGGFAGNPDSPGAAFDYYSDGGTAPRDLYFMGTGGDYAGTIRIEVGGLAATSVFGWYEWGISGPGVLHQIFAGIDGTGTTAFFTPTLKFGFYITTGDGYTYYTESSHNPKPTCAAQGYSGCLSVDESYHQHFVLFKEGPLAAWLGVEDRSQAAEATFDSFDLKSLGDYNDLIIRITETESEAIIPEPGTYALMGAGLFAVGIIRPRRSS
jgi:hypothetical protein